MQKAVFDKFSFLAFYMSLLVVGIHLSVDVFYNFDFDKPIDKLIYNQIYFVRDALALIAVPAFFIKSGILFFANFTLKDYFKKIKRRFFSIFIPFCVWNLLCYFFNLAICNFPFTAKFVQNRSVDFGVSEFFGAMFLYTNNPVNWFLFQLMFFAIISPVFYYLAKNVYIAGFVIIACLCNFACVNEFFGRFYLQYLPTAFGAYLFGVVIGVHYKNALNYIYKASTVTISWVFFAIFLATIFYIKTHNGIIISPQFSIIGAIICLWVGMSRVQITPKWWYGASFIIYESQVIVASSILKVILILLPKNSFCAAVNFYATIALSALVGIFIFRITKKYSPKVFACLNGGR